MYCAQLIHEVSWATSQSQKTCLLTWQWNSSRHSSGAGLRIQKHHYQHVSSRNGTIQEDAKAYVACLQASTYRWLQAHMKMTSRFFILSRRRALVGQNMRSCLHFREWDRITAGISRLHISWSYIRMKIPRKCSGVGVLDAIPPNIVRSGELNASS